MKYLIILIVLFYSVNSSAEYERYRLPLGNRIVTEKGTFQGYTLEEMKILLKMDTDLKLGNEKDQEQIKLISNQGSVIISLQKQNELQVKMIDILQNERKLLTEKWSKENEAKHICESKPAYGSWISWTIAAATTTAAVILGSILIYKEKNE